MSFTDEVTALDTTLQRGGVCSVAIWRGKQSPEVRAEFDAALLNDDVTAKAIWLAMKGRGFGSDVSTVQRHRRGDCKCPSPMR